MAWIAAHARRWGGDHGADLARALAGRDPGRAVVLLAQLSVAALAMVRDAYAKLATLRAELEVSKAERVVV